MKRILLDVDGVVAEFTHHLCQKIGLKCEEPDPNTFQQWDFIRAHLTKEQRLHAYDILAAQEFWATQPQMPGARKAVDLFLMAGLEVHFVTSPWAGCAGWADTRTDWVSTQMGVPAKFTHISASKYVFSGSVFVDDKMEHVERWYSEQHRHGHHDRHAFLFEAPYNRNMAWRPRLNGWTDHKTVERIIDIALGTHTQSSW